jgi:hypothetical protein
MEIKDIKDVVVGELKSTSDAINANIDTKVKAATDAVESVKIAVTKDIADVKEELNKVKAAQGKKKFSASNGVNFGEEFAEKVAESFDKIKKVSKGNAFELELKSAANMTLASDLTSGSPILTYQPGVNIYPGPKVNFRDIVAAVPSDTGAYAIAREDYANAQGAFASQTEGASIAQIEKPFKIVTYNSGYISGFARVTKQMLANLKWVQTALPQMLLRDLFIKENSIFHTALAAESGVNASVADTVSNYVERLINETANLEAYSSGGFSFDVNTIVVNPKDWAKIIEYKASGSGQYTYPGVLMVAANGELTLNGVPVKKAPWVPQGHYWIGDFGFAKRLITEDMKVEFFEQDGTNVTQNLITVRCQVFEVLGVDVPQAFTYGSFTA